MQIQTFFPLTIDSTILAEINSCPMSAFRRYVQHFNPSGESTDLVAGGALAKGLEVTRKAYYDEGVASHAAIQLGMQAVITAYGDHQPKLGSNKTVDRMVSILEEYFWEYPLETDVIQPAKLADGKYGIEYSFAHELPIEHPDMPGQNLVFVGRADMLCEYAGKLWVSDEKTTSQITADWAKQWETRGQFTAYCWGLRKAGIPVVGAYLRGIGIYKTQTKFVETVTNRSEWECENWYRQMLNTVKWFSDSYRAWRLAQDTNRSKEMKHPSIWFAQAFNESCFKYFRPCTFQDSCKTVNSEGLLAMNMEQNIWLPHLHKRVPLEQFLEELNPTT